MSEVFLKQVKLLALQRLRGNAEPQPDYPHQYDKDVDEDDNNNNNHDHKEVDVRTANKSSTSSLFTKLPPFTWSRPAVTSLWGQMEQALIEERNKKAKNNNDENSTLPEISPSRDVNSAMQDSLSYLVYRQTICREIAKELGYHSDTIENDIDNETLDAEDRAKILTMYRQHLACGPATYFDLWKNENKENISKFCQNLLQYQNDPKKQRACLAEMKSKGVLRDPSLVDVMSQIGAVGFFAELRSMLEKIRCETTSSSTSSSAKNKEKDTSSADEQQTTDAEKDEEADNNNIITKKSSLSSSTENNKKNPLFTNLLKRLKTRIAKNVVDVEQQQTSSATSDMNNNSSNNDHQVQQTTPVIPPLQLNSTDEFLNAPLSLTDLEQFVKDLIPNIRGVKDAPPWLEPYYIAHAVARIAFDAESSSSSSGAGRNNGGITISSVLESAALTDLLQLHEPHAPDAALCFPRNFPVSIGIEHAQLVQLQEEEEDEENEIITKSPEQEAAEYRHKQQLLRAAIEEAKQASDPDEMTLVEARVIYCPDVADYYNDEDEVNQYVLVTLSLADNQSVQLRVHRKYTFFPSSREALQKYREIMELLVASDETGDRVSAAELESQMDALVRREEGRGFYGEDEDDETLSGSSSKRKNNNNNTKSTENTVDNVDGDVVLSRARRIMAENWFSLPRMLALYYDFCILDYDHDGVLAHDEIMHYRNGALTNFAIDRVFEVFASGDGCIAYTTYLDFIIALEYPHLVASQKYLWKLLDIEHTGNTISVRSLMFFAIEICKVLEEKGILTMTAEGLMNELLDMLRLPTDAESVHFEKDVVASQMGGTVLPLLVDWRSFVKYESREQQRQAESIEEEAEGVDGDQNDEEEKQERVAAELILEEDENEHEHEEDEI